MAIGCIRAVQVVPLAKPPSTLLRKMCVTDNIAEFKRVPALKVENWIR